MTDKELFLKYNLVNTKNYNKDENLSSLLFNNSLKTEIFKQDKILLLLHATYNCNLSCIYCEHGALRRAYNNAIMSQDIIKQIVQKLGPWIREITWHGGEPLLIPEGNIELLEKEKRKNNLNFKTSLQTNGILLTEEKIKFLKNLNISFGTSFDGLNNDIYRGESSTKALSSLIQKYPNSIGFINVITKLNIKNLIENYEYFKKIKVNHIQSAIVKENIIDSYNPYILNNEEAIKYILEYIDYWIHDIDPVGDNFIEREISRCLGSTQVCNEIYCIGGWLVIDPIGNICFCGQSGIDNGFININDIESYKDILTNKTYLQTLNKQKKLAKKCSNCEWHSVCHGGCMGLNFEYDNNYETISPRDCDFNKRLMNGIYELIKNININDKQKYNPIFLNILKNNCYYSLTEIKQIERRFNGEYSNIKLL